MAKETIGAGLWATEYAKINRMFTELYAGMGTYTSGGVTWRLHARDGALHVDQTLNGTGFAGTESSDQGATGDWVSLWAFVLGS
jgi:hypothetical protein